MQHLAESFCLLMLTGCGDSGESLAKETNLTITDAYAEIVNEKEADKKKDIRARWDPKIKALRERAAKLPEVEKKIYDEKTKTLGEMWK